MSDSSTPGGNAKPALFSRLATAVVYAVTGNTPSWFGPSEPIAPQAPPGIGGRQFDFPTSSNLQSKPRVDEEISAEQLRNLAENCDVARLVIETRKDQLAAQTWQFQLKDKTARGKKEDPRLAMLAEFWRFPDKEHSWEDWLRPLIDDMLVIDAATIFPRKTMGGDIYGFEFVDGATIKRVIDDFGRTPLAPAPAYQQILKGLPAVNYTRDELLYLPRNLRSYKLYGMSPIQQVAMTVNIALRRTMHQLEYYTSGTVPDALAETPPGWSPEQIASYQDYFDDLLSDSTAIRRRVRFVPSGIAKGFIQTKEAALKDDFDEWLARIVCYAFSVSNQAFVKQMNRATGETAAGMANAEGLAPLMQWVKRLIDRCIRTGWGWDDIEFSWHEEQEINPAEQATVATTYMKVGALTINDVLADIGRDPIPGGDVHLIYTPTGAIPLSQVIAPPPPPVAPPQLGHNGGPPLDDAPPGAKPGEKPTKIPAAKPTEAAAEELLLKAADPEARLTQVWSHFLAHEAPRVAKAVAEALPDLPTHLHKAAENEDEDTSIEDAADAARLAAGHPAAPVTAATETTAETTIETVIEEAVGAMPWPAVQTSTAAVLGDQVAAGVTEGIDAIQQIAGIKVAPGISADAFRMANPRAIQQAADQAAALVKGVDQTTRDALNRLVVQAQREGWSVKQLKDRIEADYTFSEARASMIARTELKRSSVAGNIDSWRATAKVTGITINKRVILGQNENHCVACRSAVMEGAIPLDDSWTVGFAPPFHPSCYCAIVPVVPTATKDTQS
jgi:hypothetical protein